MDNSILEGQESSSAAMMMPPAPPVMTGTTIVAVEFEGGVVLGADSRTTITYPFRTDVYNRLTDKLSRITDKIYCCNSGKSSHLQAICEQAERDLDLNEIVNGEEVTVKHAAITFQHYCYVNRDTMCASILVAGWDNKVGGQVYSIPLGGMITRTPMAMSGSGSVYIHAYMDAHFKQGEMSKDETVDFVTKAIALAIGRDGGSGGCVYLAIITQHETERRIVTGDQLPIFYEG